MNTSLQYRYVCVQRPTIVIFVCCCIFCKDVTWVTLQSILVQSILHLAWNMIIVGSIFAGRRVPSLLLISPSILHSPCSDAGYTCQHLVRGEQRERALYLSTDFQKSGKRLQLHYHHHQHLDWKVRQQQPWYKIKHLRWFFLCYGHILGHSIFVQT